MAVMNIRADASFRAGSWAAFEAKLVPRLLKATEAAAAAVLEISQELVPVNSGALKDSGKTEVKWEGTRVTGYLVYTAAHAGFVEFGTGLRGMGTYPFALPVAGVPFTGGWVYDYKRQNWVGMPSQPYCRPALDIGRGRILEAYLNEGFYVTV